MFIKIIKLLFIKKIIFINKLMFINIIKLLFIKKIIFINKLININKYLSDQL